MKLQIHDAGGVSAVNGQVQASAVGGGGLSAAGQSMQQVAMKMQDIQNADDFSAGRVALEKGLAELDEKYKDDVEFGTMNERYEADANALRENILSGQRDAVKRKLTPRFDMRQNEHGVHFKNTVYKRDGALRGARYNEDVKELANKAVYAKTPEEREHFLRLIKERGEGIRGFVPAHEFERMQSAIADKITYHSAMRDVPEMVRAGHEFDPEQFSTLSPEKVIALENAFHAEKQKVERVQIQARADRAGVLNADIQDSLASVMQTGVPMEGTDLKLAEMEGMGGKVAEKAAEYKEMFSRSAKGWQVLEDTRYLPPADRMEAVRSVMEPQAGAEGYKTDAAFFNHIASQVQQEAKRFEADPAAYVAPRVLERMQAIGVDPNENPMLFAEKSMEMQRDMGVVNPSVFSKGRAEELRERFKVADPDGKIALLEHLINPMGDLAPKALHEIGLGHKQMYAATLFREEPMLGRMAIQASMMNVSDIAKNNGDASGIIKDVQSQFMSDGFGEVLMEKMRLTRNVKFGKMAMELGDLTTCMALLSGDAGQTMKELWGKPYSIAVDDNFVGWIPKQFNPSGVKYGLLSIQTGMKLGDLDNVNDSLLLSDIKWRGKWINSHDGKGFELVDPVTGRSFTKDGETLVVAYDEAEFHGSQLIQDSEADKMSQEYLDNVPYDLEVD
ncbi:MAG: hypothetical protein ACNI27_07415 [Desulfovibrio sp.]